MKRAWVRVRGALPWRRALLTLVVLLGGAVVLRAPAIRPSFGGALLAHSREIKVYPVSATPTRFALPQGQRELRLVVNFDLPATVPTSAVTFVLRARIPEEGRDTSFSLTAEQAVTVHGEPVAFYLGETFVPARPREIAIERATDVPGTLEVSLIEPASARGAIRVLVTQQRAPLAQELLLRRLTGHGKETLAARRGPLDWEELGDNGQAELLARRWIRLPAEGATPARRLYVNGDAPATARSEADDGIDLGAGESLAFTVRGPGTLRLEPVAESSLIGEARLLQESGEESSRALMLGAGDRIDWPLPLGLATLRVRLSVAGRALVTASSAAVAIDDAQVRPRDDGEPALTPAWSRQRAARGAKGEPVAFDLKGRGQESLRLSAWATPEAGDEQAAVQVAWSFVSAAGRELAAGRIDEPRKAAPEDRVAEASAPNSAPTPIALSDPVVVYLRPPVQAARLNLVAGARVRLAVASPGHAHDATRPQPERRDQTTDSDAPGPPGNAIVLRNAASDAPTWYAIRPANLAQLAALGRVDSVLLARRLERRPARPRPLGAAESLAPSGNQPRFSLLVPVRAAPSPAQTVRDGWWPIESARTAVVTIIAPPGGSSEARPSLNLLYVGQDSPLGAKAGLRVDGRERPNVALAAARGQVALPALPVGPHAVALSVDGRARLFINQPVAGARPYRGVGVYALAPDLRLNVSLTKTAAARELGIVVYFDGPPPTKPWLEVRIDAARRRTGVALATRDDTRLVRELPLVARALPDGLYLNRSAPEVSVAEPLFVKLGDDLAAGEHDIEIALGGTRTPAFVRFFAYGATLPKERLSQVGVARSTSP